MLGANLMFKMRLPLISQILEERLHSYACYVGRDFNIDLMQIQHNQLSTTFCNLMMVYGLYAAINIPTSITRNSATLLNNWFTNHQVIDPKVLVNDRSLWSHSVP